MQIKYVHVITHITMFHLTKPPTTFIADERLRKINSIQNTYKLQMVRYTQCENMLYNNKIGNVLHI